MFVDDVVTCNVLAATKPVSRGQVYNVGGGGRISIRDLADKILRFCGSSSAIESHPSRVGDVRDSLAGIEKARKDLGYSPKTDIENGLKRTVNWVRSAGQSSSH